VLKFIIFILSFSIVVCAKGGGGHAGGAHFSSHSIAHESAHAAPHNSEPHNSIHESYPSSGAKNITHRYETKGAFPYFLFFHHPSYNKDINEQEYPKEYNGKKFLFIICGLVIFGFIMWLILRSL